MTKRNITSFILLFVFAFLTACAPAEPETGAPNEEPPVVESLPVDEGETPEPTVEPTPEVPTDPIAEQLAALTTEQKVGQLLVAGIEGYEAGADAVTAIADYQVGGVILFGRNVESAGQLAALNNSLKALNGEHIPLFLCVDEEGGIVSRMPAELEDLPSPWYYSQIEDVEERLDACFLLGQVLGAQCAAFGFNMNFAPVMDIWSNPENTVIGRRAFGTTVNEVTYPANMTAHGLMTEGVIPVAKHFPGHGDTAVDSHVGLPVVDKTVEELWECELVPFRQAIDYTCVYGAAGGDSAIPAIMVAHILMTAIDPERPASLSPAVVDGLLREELGFDGVVCTDDLTMAAVSDTYGMGEAAVLAVEAGCDLLLVCHGTDNLTAARDALLNAVEEGRITMERLNESVYRILKLKADYDVTNLPVDETVDVDALNERIALAKP